MSKPMANLGVFIGDKKIGLITSVEVDGISDFTSPAFKYLGDPNEYEFYLRRKNRIWLRNAYGKLSIEADNLRKDTGDIKYGQKMFIDAQFSN
jgi:hypothetical protein